MGVDWSAVLEINDELRHQGTHAVFVKTIVTRLRENSRVQLLVLKLLESCMKNIGHDMRLPRAVATKELMASLAALASNKRPRGGLFNFRCANSNLGPDLDDGRRPDLEAQELARVLIRSWAEGFVAVQTEVPLFNDTYMALLRSGLGFPELSTEETIEFKPRSPFADEVEAIQTRVRLLQDMLQPQPEVTSPRPGMLGELGAELAAELEQTREDLQHRIPQLEDEEALALHLGALSQVQEVLQQCYRSAEEQSSQVAEPKASPSPEQPQKDSELTQYAPTPSQCDVAIEDHGQISAAQDQAAGDIADLLGLTPSVA